MSWIKWKCREFRKWAMYSFMYRARWKKLWNSESDNANWEIVHDSKEKTVTLHYVPNDDYSKEDVKIQMSYEHFEDLVKFMLTIK